MELKKKYRKFRSLFVGESYGNRVAAVKPYLEASRHLTKHNVMGTVQAIKYI